MTNDDQDDNKRRPRSPFDPFEPFGGSFDEIFSNIESMMRDIFEGFFKGFPDRPPERIPFDKPIVWGFRLNLGPDGVPRFQPFGHLKHEAEGIKHTGAREPLIDILEENEIIRVIAEMPGVAKLDIDLSATEDNLLIKAESKANDRKYAKEIDLPASVVPETAKATFKNGILEVTLHRKKPKRSNSSHSININ
ncbi:MAG: archaeal heat shock protein Hsp20 [Promethearchaeota archaeon]